MIPPQVAMTPGPQTYANVSSGGASNQGGRNQQQQQHQQQAAAMYQQGLMQQQAMYAMQPMGTLYIQTHLLFRLIFLLLLLSLSLCCFFHEE
jgi:hypothetical protein